MSYWYPTNPVERRFTSVHDDWMTFANDKQSYLLYWQTSEADQRILAVYIQRQETLSSAVLRLQSSFDNANQYANALADEIIARYENGSKASETNGLSGDWTPPTIERNEPATSYLLRLISSLTRHHQDVFPQLVLILEPEPVRKPAKFERWLDGLLDGIERDAWRAERLRIVLTGSESDPLPWLVAQRPHQARVLRGRYHMEALPRELVAESDQRGPDADFRRLFVAMSDIVETGTPAQLETLRAQALAITHAQAWFDQSVVVHLTSGAAYLKWNSPEQALFAYEAATQAGRQAAQARHPAGNKLTINGLFGEASVFWMQADYRRAAERYVQAAQLAEADQDGLLAVEGWRMCSACYAQLRGEAQTIAAGLRALDAGGLIAVSLRANSNLQMVAQSMLTHVGIFHRQRSELTTRLVALYGDEWPETIKPLLAEEATQRHMEALSCTAEQGARGPA